MTNAKYVAILLIVSTFVSACNSDTPEVTQKSEPDKQSHQTILKTEPWAGAASGYVSTGDPTTDRIELFVRLGQLLAAASVYQQRGDELHSTISPDKEQTRAARARVAAVFGSNLMASYAAIEPVIDAKSQQSKQALSLRGLLSELNQDQHIETLVNVDRSQHQKRSEARQRSLDLMTKIHSVALAFFPSRHEYLLASSALIREAGDKATVAVSANGVVLDADLLQEAYALIDRSIDLDPKNISFCDSQRLPIRDHKKAIDELLSKMVPIAHGEKLSVSAGNVYGLALQAQVAGERLSIKDSKQCPQG